jgi:hypothetical protein
MELKLALKAQLSRATARNGESKERESMASKMRRIVVMGASAGGLDVLDAVIGQLPPDLPASFFIVQHMAPENTGDALLHRLKKHKAFASKLAVDGETFKKGTIYIAPPDYHLLVKESTVLVTKGARENRYRPGIDPLFRSAAVTHGPSVVGVILTGMLDDGTAGLIAIRRCGGVTVVQDPKDATYPEMPQSAVNNLDVDHCVPAAQLGGLLETLIHRRLGKRKRIPRRCPGQSPRQPGSVQLTQLRRCALGNGQVPWATIPLPHRPLFHGNRLADQPIGMDRGNALDFPEDVRGTQESPEQYGAAGKPREAQERLRQAREGCRRPHRTHPGDAAGA